MNLIRHCIINTTTNLVENIVEYEEIKSGVPLGFENQAHLIPLQEILELLCSHNRKAFVPLENTHHMIQSKGITIKKGLIFS